ncbi:unnamed protein product [Hapterophycus canaliculatus]
MLLEDADAYRERKEAFVSGLAGTTMLELVLVSTPIPMGMWLLAEAKALLGGCENPSIRTLGWSGFVVEMLAVIFPAAASLVWPSQIITIVLSMAFASAFCRLQRSFLTTPSAKPGRSLDADQGKSSRWPMMNCVTNIRASIMLITCVTILAVDFQASTSHKILRRATQVFPRRFAKTEIFGTGLMDLGVGATIFASGLASGCKTKPQSEHPKLGWCVCRTMLVETSSAAVRAWPLAALGVSRLVVIKGLGYQEHVSEYGVHWNFFATLFFMRLVVVPMNRVFSARFRYYLALVAICVYQWLLVNKGLSDFIVHAPRDSLFSMNREGVLGLLGFVAIYYIASELGSQISPQRQKSDKERADPRFFSRSVVITGRAIAMLWGLTLFSEAFVQQTSRRMVNLTYVLWVCAHSMLMLGLLMLVDNVSLRRPTSRILAAINLNMFPVFMVANLATGAVNVSMRTLDAETPTAIAILAIYVTLVAGFAAALSNRGLTIKV